MTMTSMLKIMGQGDKKTQTTLRIPTIEVITWMVSAGLMIKVDNTSANFALKPMLISLSSEDISGRNIKTSTHREDNSQSLNHHLNVISVEKSSRQMKNLRSITDKPT